MEARKKSIIFSISLVAILIASISIHFDLYCSDEDCSTPVNSQVTDILKFDTTLADGIHIPEKPTKPIP